MTEYVDQAVRKIRADGVSLRRVADERDSEPVAQLEDGTELRHVDGILDVPGGDRLGFLVCQVVGHQFDGRRMVEWDDEETPAIECVRCRLVRARRPTGGSLEETATEDTAPTRTE
jgi:hypothetical protein